MQTLNKISHRYTSDYNGSLVPRNIAILRLGLEVMIATKLYLYEYNLRKESHIVNSSFKFL